MQRHVELNSCSILAVAACVLVLYFGTATTPIHRINNVRHSRVQVQFRSDSPRDGGPLNSTAELQAAVASTRLRNNTQLAQDAYTTSALANLTQFRAGVLSAGLSFFGVSKASAGRDGAPSLWNLLGPIVHCPTNSPLTRYGGSGDGGKLLCKLPPTSDTACVIYSLGSNGEQNNVTSYAAVVCRTELLQHCHKVCMSHQPLAETWLQQSALLAWVHVALDDYL
jgi:hypothetical protein